MFFFKLFQNISKEMATNLLKDGLENLINNNAHKVKYNLTFLKLKLRKFKKSLKIYNFQIFVKLIIM